MRLIDADKLVDKFGGVDGWNMGQFQTDEIVEIIEEQPTIEAEPVRHGKWIKKFIESAEWNWDELYYECSECTLLSETVSEFCPHCGTKMDGVANET